MASLAARPKFNSQRTSDRLREGAGLYLPPHFRASAKSNIPKGRVSVFKELGLDDDVPCSALPDEHPVPQQQAQSQQSLPVEQKPQPQQKQQQQQQQK